MTQQLPTRPGLLAAENVIVDTATGGRIGIGATDSEPPPWFPGQLSVLPDGVALGPLTLSVPAGAQADIERLSFASNFDDGGLFSLSTAAAGAVPAVAAVDEDSSVSRREFVAGVGVLVGAAALATPTRAADDTGRLRVASWTVDRNPRGLHVSIPRLYRNVLPRNQTYYLRLDGTRVEQFDAEVSGGVLPPGATGNVELATDASLIADLRRYWNGEAVTHSHTLELPQLASEYEDGETVLVARSPAIVEPVREAGASRTVVTIGDESVPHASEGSLPVGSYRVSADGLEYTVGVSPPARRDLVVRAEIGRLDELLDDASRW